MKDFSRLVVQKKMKEKKKKKKKEKIEKENEEKKRKEEDLTLIGGLHFTLLLLGTGGHGEEKEKGKKGKRIKIIKFEVEIKMISLWSSFPIPFFYH